MEKQTGQGLLQKIVMPIAVKLEGQKHLQAIKEGMIAIMPIIIIGSFSLLPIAIKNLIGTGSVADTLGNLIPLLTYCNLFTTGLISIYSAYFIASSLAKKYDLKNPQVAIISVISTIILCSVSIDGGISVEYLGSGGMFVSIIVSLFTVEITRFLIEKKIIIKLPDSVPPMVGQSFSALIPMFICIAIASTISFYIQKATGSIFPAWLMKILAPTIKSMDTLPAMLIIIFLTQILWFFGLHGPGITSSVWIPFAISYGAANVAAFAAGQKVEHFFTFGFYYALLQVSGSGLTLGLVILMCFSKAKGIKSIGRSSLIPSLFGINEPVIFGLPIILNPFMFIPFVFGPLVVTVVCYLSMSTGLVGMPIVEPPGFLPPGVGAFLMTMDFKAVLLVLACLLFMTAFYFPFFKMMEADELKKENA